MGKTTGILWTDHTFNPWWGCEKVSPGCKNCYAEALASRYHFNIWGPNGSKRRLFPDNHWQDPRNWNRAAERVKVRRRVFSGSMCDVFEDHDDLVHEREKLWAIIRETPWLDWQLLTKRADKIRGFLPADWGNGYDNVWLGVSAENQELAEKRVPVLLEIPARVRFVSAEPLLGNIAFDNCLSGCYTSDWSPKFGAAGIHWVIYGGESGDNRRECDVKWIVNGALLCKSAGVACFVKQDSGRRSGHQGRIPDEIWAIKEFPAVRPANPAAALPDHGRWLL